MTEQARLHFMGFRNNFLYYPDGQLGWDTELYRRVNALPERRIWQFMELYTGLLGQHAFCVCHPSRPAKSYKIDFAASSLLDCLPVLRCKEVPLQAGAAAGAISLRREPAPAVFTFPPDAAALIRQNRRGPVDQGVRRALRGTRREAGGRRALVSANVRAPLASRVRLPPDRALKSFPESERPFC